MKIIRNNINWLPIPFKGYKACLLFGLLIIRGDTKLTYRLMNHEHIHVAQMREMFYILFYLWYGVEWLTRVVVYFIRFMGRYLRDKSRKVNLHLAYRKISFEKEARSHERNLEYLKQRKSFAWLAYI